MSINVEELVERRTSESFPNFLVSTPNDTMPVVVRTLEKGDMQLIVELNGKRKVVAKISPSAFNVDKLLRTIGTFKYVIAPDMHIEVDNITTYLSCIT